MALAGVAVVGSFVGSAHDASQLTKTINENNVLGSFQGMTAKFTGREAHLTGASADKDAAIAAVEDQYGVRWASFTEGSGAQAPAVELPGVDITGLDGGGATLTGSVPSEEIKAQLEEQAQRIFGSPVTNNLSVDPKLSLPDWFSGFTAALPALPQITGGGIKISGDGLNVSGLVPDQMSFDGIKTALGSLPSLPASFDGLSIAPATASPSPEETTSPEPAVSETPAETPAETPSAEPTLAAVDPSVRFEPSGSGVSLSGVVPSQEIKDQLIEQATRIYGAADVNADGLKVEPNAAATGWLTGFLGALPKLPAIKGGSLALDASGLTVSGEVKDQAAADAATAALKAGVSLPSQSVNLTAPAPQPSPKPAETKVPVAAMPDDVAKAINGIVVHFPTASTSIQGAEQRKLNDTIAQLKKYSNAKLELDGYVSLPNRPETRIPLSKARADVVKAYLVKGGIDASRITSVGKGASNPVADNNTAAGRLANQRVQLVVTER